MLPFRLMFVAAIALVASCTKAPPPAYYDSLRLVSAMREDELMLLAVRAAKASQLEAKDAMCLDRYEFPELTDIAARQISDKMSAAEVEDALGYFQSAGGRKFVRRAELEATGKLADAAQLSSAEQAELEQFKQRPAGRKLLQDRITADTISMAEATTRFERHVEDCGYRRQNESARLVTPVACKSKFIASADNVCLANYAAEGSGAARKASVEVFCRHNGKFLRTQIDLPQPQSPIALRWSPSRELEILVQNDKMRIISSSSGDAAQRFRWASRKPSDPPVLECLPERTPELHGTLATTLPLSITMGAWRAHQRPGLCLMTARVPKEQMPGAGADVLLQFRRHQSAVLPFATSELALIAQIHEMKERPAQVALGPSPLLLIGHQPQLYMLAGKEAEELLQSLASQPNQLAVQPEGASSYSVPISRQDFDFAYAGFSECLAGLKTT